MEETEVKLETAGTEKQEPEEKPSGKKKKKGSVEDKRVKNFWFSTRLSVEDKEIISEKIVLHELQKHATVESYSYCLHSDDTITEYDKDVDEDGTRWGNVGDPKPLHIHVAGELNTAVKVGQIAKWFGLPVNMIRFQTRDNQQFSDPFRDMTAYWTHEFEPEYKQKHIYPRERVKVGGKRAATIWDDIAEFYEKREQRKGYNVSRTAINDALYDIAEKGMTLAEAKKKLGIVPYLKNEKDLKRARREYVLLKQPMPAFRTVFYVDCIGDDERSGKGGIGKTACTHALAKQCASEFCPENERETFLQKSYDELSMEGYIFDLGGEGVELQAYDGQPILVCNEMDDYSMYRAFKRRGIKELLDNFPTRQGMNIKYGDTVVTAKYIIINGIQRYDTFIENMSSRMSRDGEKEDGDRTQYDRRVFGIITLIDEDYMDVFFNKGILDGTDEYRQYYVLRHVYAPFKRSLQQFHPETVGKIESEILEPVMLKTRTRDNLIRDKVGKDSEEYREVMNKIIENQERLEFTDSAAESAQEQPWAEWLDDLDDEILEYLEGDKNDEK